MDIMRILATFLVVFNHTGDFGFSYFRRFGSHTIAYWGYMLFPVMAKVSVPLFFMISGALLLGREDESRKKMLLRWIKIFAALLVFSCVSYAQQIYLGNEVFDIKHFVFVFFNNTWMNAYWYLYAYLGYLLTLPLLRKIAKSLTDSNYRYMIVLVLVLTGYLPMILYVVSKGTFSLNTSFKIDWLASSIFFFPLLGYYLERRVPVEKISGLRTISKRNNLHVHTLISEHTYVVYGIVKLRLLANPVPFPGWHFPGFIRCIPGRYEIIHNQILTEKLYNL